MISFGKLFPLLFFKQNESKRHMTNNISHPPTVPPRQTKPDDKTTPSNIFKQSNLIISLSNDNNNNNNNINTTKDLLFSNDLFEKKAI